MKGVEEIVKTLKERKYPFLACSNGAEYKSNLPWLEKESCLYDGS